MIALSSGFFQWVVIGGYQCIDANLKIHFHIALLPLRIGQREDYADGNRFGRERLTKLERRFCRDKRRVMA